MVRKPDKLNGSIFQRPGQSLSIRRKGDGGHVQWRCKEILLFTRLQIEDLHASSLPYQQACFISSEREGQDFTRGEADR
jgi:hypothetical protein